MKYQCAPKSLFACSLIAISTLTACGANERWSLSAPIVGGEIVEAGEEIAAMTVALLTDDGGICTGSILSKDIVLTAAHCLPEDNSKVRIIFGISVFAEYYEERTSFSYRSHMLWPTSSNNNYSTHDIGVVYFGGGLPEGYKPAKILTDNSVLKNQAKVVIAGYGVSNGWTQRGAGILRKTQVPILDENFSRTEIRLDSQQGSGSCQGDSGGPAFIVINGELLLWGVTSRGEMGCEISSVYTLANVYNRWISDSIAVLRENTYQ